MFRENLFYGVDLTSDKDLYCLVQFTNRNGRAPYSEYLHGFQCQIRGNGMYEYWKGPSGEREWSVKVEPFCVVRTASFVVPERGRVFLIMFRVSDVGCRHWWH